MLSCGEDAERITFSEFESKLFLSHFSFGNLRKSKCADGYCLYKQYSKNFANLLAREGTDYFASPLDIFRMKSTLFSWSKLNFSKQIETLPIFSVDLSKTNLTEANIDFRFIDVPGEEPFTFWDTEGGEVISTQASKCKKSRWVIKKFDPSAPLRVCTTFDYIAEEELFLIFGGLVPTKYLPDDYADIWCRQIMIEKRDLGSEKAYQLLMNSYFQTNDLWKYYVREDRWEKALDLTPLIKSESLDTWYRNSARPGLISCTPVVSPKQKKIYYIVRLCHSLLGEFEFYEYDYGNETSNIKRVEKIEKNLQNLGNFRTLIVDDFNDTMVFLSGTLNRLTVLCLKTYKTMDIPLWTDLPKEKVGLPWHLLLMGEKKLLIYAIKGSVLENERESSVMRYEHAFIDWERVRRERITVFLKCQRVRFKLERIFMKCVIYSSSIFLLLIFYITYLYLFYYISIIPGNTSE